VATSAEELLAVGLASAALWCAWREGSLFAAWRERAEAWSGLEGRKRPLALLGELLGCPACAAFWLAGGVAGLLALCRWLSPAAGAVATFVLRVLAAAGLAHLLWGAHNYLTRTDNEQRPQA
jgi:hypothetical protein